MKGPTAPELDYVLSGIARSRVPGFNFPGNFLQVAFDRVTHDASTLSLDAASHCVDQDGQLNVGAMAVLADMALATSLRETIGRSTRLSTVSLNLQFTGARRTGRLVADATFDGLIPGLAGEQGLTRVSIASGGKVVCTGSGAFMAFRSDEKKLEHPMESRARDWLAPAVPAIADLTPEEAAVYSRARRALKASNDRSFIENFWGYLPRTTAQGATATMPIGIHIGNRVGQAQGGIAFGFAAACAAEALPGSWSLVAAHAWYVGPGLGKHLRAKAKVVHSGRLTAVVQTRVVNAEGRAVLECVTSHAKVA